MVLEKLASLGRHEVLRGHIRLRAAAALDRTVQGRKGQSVLLGHQPLEAQSKGQGAEAPEKTADGRGHKSAKGTPVVGVQALLEDEKLTTLLGAAVVDGSEDEDGEQTTETTNYDLEAAPPPEAVHETKAQHGNGGGRDEIGDEVDLQNRWRLDGDDDGGENDEDDEATDEPDVEPVAEQVVGSSRNHGRLETVKSSRAEGDHHDQNNADHPRGQLVQHKEEGDGPRGGNVIGGKGTGPDGDETGAADEDEDAEDYGRGQAGAETQILVSARGKGAQPEAGQKEVVGQDGDGQDVEELPAEKARLEEVRAIDEAAIHVHLDANGNGSDDDQKDDHDALHDIGDEGDFETSESWAGRQYAQGEAGHGMEKLTSVDGGDDALYDHDGQRIKTGESVDDLTDGRQLSHHVQKQGDEGHEAQIQHSQGAVALTGPLGEHEAFGTFATDDGTEEAKDEHGKGRRQSVDDNTLNTGDGGQLRVGEEDTGAESYNLVSCFQTESQWGVKSWGMQFGAATLFPRKH